MKLFLIRQLNEEAQWRERKSEREEGREGGGWRKEEGEGERDVYGKGERKVSREEKKIK